MAFVKDVLGKRALGAQYKLVSSGYVDHTAFAANDAADDLVAVELPPGALINRVSLTLETAFDVATTLTTSIVTDDGDGTSTDLDVLDTDFDADSATANLREDWDCDNTADIAGIVQQDVRVYVTLAIASITSLTAGRARVDVEYYVAGRSNENEG